MSERYINKVHGILIHDVRVDELEERVKTLENSGGSGEGVKAVTVDTVDKLPIPGNPSGVYFIREPSSVYRWDNTIKSYVCVGSDVDEIKLIIGGNAFV